MSFMSAQEAQQTADSQSKDYAMSRFYWNSVLDPEATKKANGVQKYKDVLYVEILQPGLRKQGFNGKASPEHIARFQGAHDRFMEGNEATELDGFPISKWPGASPAEKDNLRVLKFLTVQSLADAPDAALKGMGMRDLSNRAQKFIEALTGPDAMANKMEELEKRFAAMKADTEETIKAQAAEIKKLKKESK